MARALSNAGAYAALREGAALLANRRGYSGAAAAMMMVTGRKGATAEETAAAFMRGRKDSSADAAAAAAWLPDPVTGYYRPANRAREIDAAELREMRLNQKKMK